MENQIGARALQMIHAALSPIVKQGRLIERLKLVVCPFSPIAEYGSVQTKYGRLRIEGKDNVPKGYSYIIEDPGILERAFAWVSKDMIVHNMQTERRKKSARKKDKSASRSGG